MGTEFYYDEKGRAVILVDIESILFNTGKQIHKNQSRLTRWKNNFKKKGKLVMKEEDLIVLELTKEGIEDNNLKELEINLTEYPFLYYIHIKKSVLDNKGKEVIIISKDLTTLREEMIKDLLALEEQYISDIVVLYMWKPLDIRISCENEDGYVDYHTASSWVFHDIGNKGQVVLYNIEFDLYEIEIEDEQTVYKESTYAAECIINTRLDKSKKIRVIKNGKEIEQGLGCSDADTKENWLYKGEELDSNRKIIKYIKLLEKR